MTADRAAQADGPVPAETADRGPGDVGGRSLELVTRAHLEIPAPDAARWLLGRLLVRQFAHGHVVARIVETEAYREDDPASHSYRGRTARTAPMFAGAGTAYVYRSYGVHWCCNVTVEQEGTGAAVLLRAARVVEGAAIVRARRGGVGDRSLLRGPGNLASGLGIDAPRHDGIDLTSRDGNLWLGDDGWRAPGQGGLQTIVAGPRVGVSLAADVPWRFWLQGVPEVSAYRRSPRAPTAPVG